MLFIGLYAEYKYANVIFLLWLFYALTPLLDYMLPLDNYNLPSHLVRTYQKDQRFLFPLYMTFTFDLFAYVYMMWLVSTDHI